MRSTCQAARRAPRLALGTAGAAVVVTAGVAAAVGTSATPAGGVTDSVNHARTVSQQHGPARHTAPHRSRKSHDSTGHGKAADHSAKPARHGKPAAHKAPAKHHSAPARKPYLIYDSVTPSALPSHRAVAVYATGNYAASPAQVHGHGSVLWIDTNGSDHRAGALDVEPGDATPSLAASWARARLSADPSALARIYTMRSEWPAVKAAVAQLPSKMQSHVRYWIADPTGVPHVVPGSAATQWYWGKSYDITTATPRFSG